MLGKFTGKEKTNSSLDLATRDGRLLVVVSKLGGLGGNLLEDVVHEGVHDAHGFTGDTSLGVDLLQNLVDVHGVSLLSGLSALLLLAGGLGNLHGCFLLSFLASCNFDRHGNSFGIEISNQLNQQKFDDGKWTPKPFVRFEEEILNEHGGG